MALLSLFARYINGDAVPAQTGDRADRSQSLSSTITNESTFLVELTPLVGKLVDQNRGAEPNEISKYTGYRAVGAGETPDNIITFRPAEDWDNSWPQGVISSQKQIWNEAGAEGYENWFYNTEGMYDDQGRYIDGDYYDRAYTSEVGGGFSKDGHSVTRTYRLRHDDTSVYHGFIYNGEHTYNFSTSVLYLWDVGLNDTLTSSGSKFQDCISVSEDGNGSLLIHPDDNVKTSWDGLRFTRPTSVSAGSQFLSFSALGAKLYNVIPLGYAGDYFYLFCTAASTDSAPRVAAIHITTYAVTEDVLLLQSSDFIGSVFPDKLETPSNGGFCHDLGNGTSVSVITMTGGIAIKFILHHTTPASSSFTVYEPTEGWLPDGMDTPSKMKLIFAGCGANQDTGEIYAYRIWYDYLFNTNPKNIFRTIFSKLRLDVYNGKWDKGQIVTEEEYFYDGTNNIQPDNVLVNENPGANNAGFFPHHESILFYSDKPDPVNGKVHSFLIKGLWKAPATNTWVIEGSGGAAVSGSAGQNRGYGYTGIGGPIFSGDALVEKSYIYSVSPDGGAVISGNALVEVSFIFVVSPAGGVILSGNALVERGVIFVWLPSGGVFIAGDATAHKLPFEYHPTGGVIVSGTINTDESNLKPVITVYDVVITGENDSLEDYFLLLKSFSGTFYSALISNLHFQLVRKSDDIQAIIDRPNGEIILYRNKKEVARGLIETYAHYSGPEDKTISIRASYIAEETTPKTVSAPVENITFDFAGKRTFQVPGFLDFQPLDLLNYDNQNIEIDFVMPYISVENSYFKLKEK